MEPRSGRSHLLQPVDSDEELFQSRQGPAQVTVGQPPRKTSLRHSHPRPPPTPNTGLPSAMSQPGPNPLLPSAPASPPTPAPSPTPHQRASSWIEPNEAIEDSILRDARLVFGRLDIASKESWLASIVDSCDNHLLSFLHQLVSPRLKKDPFRTLPNELCFKVSWTMIGWPEAITNGKPDTGVCGRSSHVRSRITSFKTMERSLER
jgi:hypothetical protein